MKYVYRVVIPLVGIAVLIVGWIRYQETAGIFIPRSYPKSRLDHLPESIEFVKFQSRDGVRLTGLMKRGRPDSPVIVFTHGNAGHMLDRMNWIETGFPEGWTGLLLDYRGYGLSEGEPSVSGVKKDARAAAAFALEESGSDQLYLYGRSLGVPLAAYAAQFYEPEGMILESGFPSVNEVAPHFMPLPGVQYLVSVRLDTVEYVRNAQEKFGPFPKLIIHGTEDRILPFSLGKSLYNKLPDPKQKLWIDGAGHNNLRAVAGEEYFRTYREFLTEGINK